MFASAMTIWGVIQYYQTFLVFASSEGHIEVVNPLLEKQVSIKVIDKVMCSSIYK